MITQAISIALGGLFSISEILPFITNGNTYGIIHYIISSLIKDKKLSNNIENIIDDIIPDEHSSLNSENHSNYNSNVENTKTSDEVNMEELIEENLEKLNLNKSIDEFSIQLDNILETFTEYKYISEKVHLGQLDTLDKLNNNLDNNMTKILDTVEKLNLNVNHKIDLLNTNLTNNFESNTVLLKKIFDKLNTMQNDENVIKKLDDIYSELYKVNHSEWDVMLEMILEHLQEVQRKNLQIANDDEMKYNSQTEKNNIILKEIQDAHFLLSTKYYEILKKIEFQIESNDENIVKHVDNIKKYMSDEIENVNSKLDGIKKKK
jgi:hypothetical protein